MVESTTESLRDCIARIMKEKGLRVRDIRRRSESSITESYISEILKGVATNPSIEKLVALGRGLGIDPVELFKVASGSRADDAVRRAIDRSYAVKVLDMTRSIALSPTLIAIAEEVSRLSERDAEVALQSLAELKESGIDRASD